jgi:ADP-ribosylglycohydrolase
MLSREKIQGMLVGGAIGDAWGMAVEGLTPETIQEKFSHGLHEYHKPDGHKYFDGIPAGTVTDDTILTVATLVAIIESGTLNMDAIASAHVMALKNNSLGWGSTTKEAVELLSNGHFWLDTGRQIARKEGRGYGNGILMKAGALGAFYATEAGGNYGDKFPGFNQLCVEFSGMTHYTKMAAMSGIIHANAINVCLHSVPDRYNVETILDLAASIAWEWGKEKSEDHTYYDIGDFLSNEDNLETRMLDLWKHRREISGWTPEMIRSRYGTSSYTYQSMPFSYAMFVKNPYSAFQAGLDTVNQGGDSDTNAKVVLELIGALHGVGVFQTDENRWMVEGLACYDRLMDLANKFCDQFGVN